VPLPIGHVLDHRLVLPEEFEDLCGDLEVRLLRTAADVVDLPWPPVLEDKVDGPAVVEDVEPVADVLAAAVDRDLLSLEEVRGKERDQLLGELVGPVVVGAPGDDHREAVGDEERAGQQV